MSSSTKNNKRKPYFKNGIDTNARPTQYLYFNLLTEPITVSGMGIRQCVKHYVGKDREYVWA